MRNKSVIKDNFESSLYVIKVSFRYAGLYLIPIIILKIITGIIPALVGFASKDLVDKLSEFYSVPSEKTEIIKSVVVIVVMFGVYKLLPAWLSAANDYFTQLFKNKMNIKLSGDLYENHIKNISALAYQNTDFNNKKNIFLNNGGVTDTMLFIVYFIGEFSGIIAAAIAFWDIYPWLVFVVLSIIPYSFIAVKFVPDFFEKMLIEENMMNARDEYRDVYSDPNKLTELKIYKNSEYFKNKLDKTASDWASLNRKLSVKYQGIIPYIPILAVTVLKSVILMIIVYFIYNGKMEIGDLVLFTSVSYVFNGYSYLFERMNSYSVMVNNVSWYRGFISQNEWTENTPGTESVNLGEIISIRFENVSFAYGENTVLNDISFEIHSGEYIAIAGINGAGKSTLIKLICGLYRPTSGEIYYNDIPLSKLKLSDVRKQMAYLSQTYFKYGITLKENITFGGTDEDNYLNWYDKLNLADIGADNNQPMLSNVNEKGRDLSEGQWQRVAIARCFNKKNASVALLDEPSASLDAVNENRIFGIYAGESQFNIKLIVTHRLSCVKDVNRIIVIDNGRIIEDGSHSALYAKKGMYYDLYNTQAEKYVN